MHCNQALEVQTCACGEFACTRARNRGGRASAAARMAGVLLHTFGSFSKNLSPKSALPPGLFALPAPSALLQTVKVNLGARRAPEA